MNETARIYDHLLKFESKNKKEEPYSIHKKLDLPDKSLNILDWLKKYVSFSKEDYILDAGCGTGYSLFYLNELYELRGLGISLSPAEIRYAHRACRKKQLDGYLDFKLDDYQHHRGGPYSKILAIESLKHADNLEQSIFNLLNRLSANGKLIIIDDFVVSDSEEINRQKIWWNSKGFRRLDEYGKIFHAAGILDFQTIDLTPGVKTRPAWILYLMYFTFRLIRYLTTAGTRRNIRTYLGALLLEKFYLKNQVSYLVLIIEKKKIKKDEIQK